MNYLIHYKRAEPQRNIFKIVLIRPGGDPLSSQETNSDVILYSQPANTGRNIRFVWGNLQRSWNNQRGLLQG